MSTPTTFSERYAEVQNFWDQVIEEIRFETTDIPTPSF